MTGMGAGFIIVPVLLVLGVHTRVAAATSGFMYFFVAFSSILTVMLENYLAWDVTLFYIGLTLLGGFTISKLIYHLVTKYQIQSIVMFILLALAVLNIVCTIFNVFKQEKLQGWSEIMKMHDYCAAS